MVEDFLVQRIQDRRATDGQNGDPVIVATQNVRNVPRLARALLRDERLTDRKVRLHLAIGTHFVERGFEPELVHESEGRPHHEADLDAHLEVGDVRDAARDHFVHESKIRPDHPLFDHSSTLGWDVHFLTARRNLPWFS